MSAADGSSVRSELAARFQERLETSSRTAQTAGLVSARRPSPPWDGDREGMTSRTADLPSGRSLPSWDGQSLPGSPICGAGLRARIAGRRRYTNLALQKPGPFGDTGELCLTRRPPKTFRRKDKLNCFSGELKCAEERRTTSKIPAARFRPRCCCRSPHRPPSRRPPSGVRDWGAETVAEMWMDGSGSVDWITQSVKALLSEVGGSATEWRTTCGIEGNGFW